MMQMVSSTGFFLWEGGVRPERTQARGGEVPGDPKKQGSFPPQILPQYHIVEPLTGARRKAVLLFSEAV